MMRLKQAPLGPETVPRNSRCTGTDPAHPTAVEETTPGVANPALRPALAQRPGTAALAFLSLLPLPLV
jgi:hypothetical protein